MHIVNALRKQARTLSQVFFFLIDDLDLANEASKVRHVHIKFYF